VRSLGHAVTVARAFTRMGYLLEFAYPLAFVFTQMQALVPVFIYFFVAKLVNSSNSNVGGDYFTFVIIGVLSIRVLAVVQDLSSELDSAIQQGRLETLLVEPLPWRALPFALIPWSLIVRLVTVALLVFITVPMGAHYNWSGMPEALLITLLGTVSTLVIGVLATSVKVLSKRNDPILAVYGLVVQVLSGAFFPLSVLPAPLRLISRMLPQTYVIDANRHLLLLHPAGLSGATPMQAIVVLVAFAVVGYAVSLWLLGRTLDYAREIGVLGGY